MSGVMGKVKAMFVPKPPGSRDSRKSQEGGFTLSDDIDTPTPKSLKGSVRPSSPKQPERFLVPQVPPTLASMLACSLVHAKITSYLHVRHLFNTAVVGRAWRDSFWVYCQRLELTLLSHKLTDSHLSRLLKRVPHVRAVNVSKCRYLSNAGLRLICALPELEELNLEGCGNSFTDFQVLASCVKLKKLNLSGCAKVDDVVISIVATNCRGLDDLGLNGLQQVRDSTLVLVSQMPNLRWLRLNGTAISAKGVPSLFNLGARLLGCHLGYCSTLTDDILAGLLKACPNITTLLLYGCTSLTDIALGHLGKARHLIQLDLSMCRRITDEGVRALVGRSSSLESLNIYDCVNVTDVALQNIADSCPSLKYLGAFGLPHLTDVAVNYVLDHSRALRRAEFGGCPGIKTAARRTTTLLVPALPSAKRISVDCKESDMNVLPLTSPSIFPLSSSPWPSLAVAPASSKILPKSNPAPPPPLTRAHLPPPPPPPPAHSSVSSSSSSSSAVGASPDRQISGPS